MGKQSKRKNRGGNSKKGELKSSLGNDANEKPSTLLQRLRHADARTRHAALTAIASTLLDPDTLLRSRKVIPLDLLQAIREKIMDDDLECAQAAAGCLANYLSYGQSNRSQMQETASWTMVLLQRLKLCDRSLKEKKDKSIFAVAAQSLHTLCSLIETNELAVDGLLQNQSISILVNLIQISKIQLEQNKDINVPGTVSINSFLEDVANYASRTLHSALDDNQNLLKHWCEINFDSWQILQNCCISESLPMICRLHCAGCLVTARGLSENASFQISVISTVLPFLNQLLQLKLNPQVIQDFMDCHKLWKEEQNDQKVELDAIQNVSRRKESARSIARRQKVFKSEQQKTIRPDEALEDKELPDANIEKDCLEALEEARLKWQNSISPLELALEIIANLTSVAPPLDDLENVDMEEEMNSDEECTTMLQNNGFQDRAISTKDLELIQAVVQSGIPLQLLKLLEHICQPSLGDTLVDIQEDINSLQSKCGACVGNCCSEFFPKWTEGLLHELVLALHTSKGNPSIATAIAAGLRSSADFRKQCQPSDLQFFLELTSSSSCQKEAVEILGILCSSESHSQEVNIQVCTTLMAISSKKAAIVGGILDAFMDIYGNDECHPNVFKSQNVLGFFQRTLPSFKKWIQCDKVDSTEDEVEQWKETALNSSRFINYKKNHC
jgi:hypothetical protein